MNFTCSINQAIDTRTPLTGGIHVKQLKSDKRNYSSKSAFEIISKNTAAIVNISGISATSVLFEDQAIV